MINMGRQTCATPALWPLCCSKPLRYCFDKRIFHDTVEPLYNDHLKTEFSGRCKEVAVMGGGVGGWSFNKRI